jgi:hypothetical protein
MRVAMSVIAGVFILSVAVGSSLSAGSSQSAGAGQTVRVPPPSMADLNAAARPKETAQSKPANGVSAITTGDCTNAGGSVYADTAGVCPTGKYCGREDAYHRRFRVCITAQ